MLGFLNLDKPLGLTSHDCIAQLRRLLKIKRVGHGGTLDPMATGVLPIAIGPATRLLPYLPETKAYIGTVRFGLVTTTDDITGDPLKDTAADHLTLETLQDLLPQFVGILEQRPPAYSAIQVAGQRLYTRARAGEVVNAPPRQVEIKQMDVLAWQAGVHPELTLRIVCGSGTYIRALARDLGAQLGVGGTLCALRRIESGGLTIEQSIPLGQINPTYLPLLSPQAVLGHLPWITLAGSQIEDWYHGRAVQGQPWAAAPVVVGVTGAETHTCLGVGICEGDRLQPKVVLPPLA